MRDNDFNLEEMKMALEATLDDFVQKIKEGAGYIVFEQAVRKQPDKDHEKLLQLSAAMDSLTDRNFSLMMESVSHDLLFSVVAQKLKNEILEGTEDGNAN